MHKRTRCERTVIWIVRKTKEFINKLEYEEVFSNSITIERLKLIVKFIEELNLK